MTAQVWGDDAKVLPQNLDLFAPHGSIEGKSVQEDNRWTDTGFVVRYLNSANAYFAHCLIDAGTKT